MVAFSFAGSICIGEKIKNNLFIAFMHEKGEGYINCISPISVVFG